MPDLLTAARALLARIDDITTEEFARGGERPEREALRLAIAQAEMPLGSQIRMPDHDTVYTVDRVYLRGADPYLSAHYLHAGSQLVGLHQPLDAVVRV